MGLLPSLKELVSGGIAGIATAAGDIISKFKADPTKVAEIGRAHV